MITIEEIIDVANTVKEEGKWIKNKSEDEYKKFCFGVSSMMRHLYMLEEQDYDTWFINETIAVRYDSLCMVFIFIKVRNTNESNNE